MIDVLMPGGSDRLRETAAAALEGTAHRFLSAGDDLRGKRVLFALSTDEGGMDAPTLALLRRLRLEKDAMQGSCAAVLLDGAGELYTKQLAQDVVFAANGTGCAFMGKPLVEGTGSLYNQHILAARLGLTPEQTYRTRARGLVRRLETFQPPRFRRPRLLMLHASESGRSSTLWMGREICRRLSDACEITELSLRNGTIHDCRGCSYRTCLHFAENGGCFYGGAISETVLPAIRDCDAMLFLCPNYNDAVGANISALFNRLTSLLLQSELYDKYLFGIVVSGYSGGDLVARQLLGAMCLNKTAMLPPRFCLLRTANDLPTAQHARDAAQCLDEFARRIRETICLWKT